MGGGDLNLKKSWHPSTMKNQERVWKAEQEKLQEEKKIAELKRNIEEEHQREKLQNVGEQCGKLKKKDNPDLNWMYKGPGSHVTREEYLLGRKIDKSFELLQKEDKEGKSQAEEQSKKSSYVVEHDINPESVVHREDNNIQVDMRRKLLEDPLLMIRQNEESTKRAITANPVKMKQLQLLMESLKKKKNKKNKSIEAKSKKKKSRKEKKYKSKTNKKKKKKHSKKVSGSDDGSTTSSSSSSESEPDPKTTDFKQRKMIKNMIDRETKRMDGERQKHTLNRLSSEENRERGLRTIRERSRSQEFRKGNRDRSRSDERRYRDNEDRGIRDERRERYRDDRERERSFHERRECYDRKERANLHRSRSRSRERRRRRKSEEKESKDMNRMREEMMQNSLKRDSERKANVEKYREEKEREEREHKKYENRVSRELGASSVSSTVESRIRSKVSSLQRKNGHMDQNFLRK